MKAIENKVELEASLVAFLNEESYYDHEIDMDPDEILCLLYGVRLINKNTAVILGFDYDAEMYFVTAVKLKKGEWNFADDSLGWWEHEEFGDAKEYFNTVKKV